MTLLFSNVFLTLVNRSYTFTIFTTIQYRNILVPVIIGISILLIAAMQWIPFVSNLFSLEPLNSPRFLQCVIVAFGATMWIELYKGLKQKKH
jgi:Ca2+-transporting ATPase